MYRLKSYKNPVPGSFYYEQTEGIQRKFGPLPMPESIANDVTSFRKANGLPRATYAEALLDVDCYTCARLGNDPAYCWPVAGTFAPATDPNSHSYTQKRCRGCGASIK